MPTTFVRFLLRFKHDDTPAGDLARDLLEDPCAKRTWGYARLRKHLTEDHRACDDALDTLDLCHEAYKRLKEEERPRQASRTAPPTEGAPVASG